MREIALDTETTGLDPVSGDRIVEIGCVELHRHVRTGRRLHLYINPGIPMPEEAFAVHGLDDAFLSDKPAFEEVAEAFLDFIAGDPLVIHNASFDMKFLNAELTRLGHRPLPMARAVDTLAMARQMFPGAQASLDALCKRFAIDNTTRVLHGALLDAELLADVYLELRGGRAPELVLGGAGAGPTGAGPGRVKTPRPPRPHTASEAELAAHAAFLDRLKDPIWLR